MHGVGSNQFFRNPEMPNLLDHDLVESSSCDPSAPPIIETMPGSRSALSGRDRRRHRRFAVRPMFSSVRLRDDRGHLIDGHLHDISISGARFEADGELPQGTSVEFEIELPGRAATLRGRARVVRVIPPGRMVADHLIALEFERFDTRIESATLTRYLEQGSLLRAA